MSAVPEKRVVVEEGEVEQWAKLESQEDRVTQKIEEVSLKQFENIAGLCRPHR